MKILHYNYLLSNKKNKKMFKVDLRTFIKNYVNSSNNQLKNSIKYSISGDNLYLINAGKNFYLFLRTREDEIIKAIEAKSMRVYDIYQKLSNNEKLGFASYIYFGKNFCSFATTQSGPKTGALSELIEQLLRLAGIRDYEFKLVPIKTEMTKNEALRFGFIGRTIVELNPNHDLFKMLLQTLAIGGNYVDSIEVIIKPKRKSNIKDDFSKILERIGPDTNQIGIKKILFKAKNEIGESLKEFFLIGNNYSYDYINYPKERPCLEVFEEKIKRNSVLKNHLEKFKEDKNYEEDYNLQALIDNISRDYWDNISIAD